MPTLNTVHLIGNLTRNCETRHTEKGTAVANGGIAVNRTWKNEAGEKKEDVLFLDFTAWTTTGENLAKLTRKGSTVLLTGRLCMVQYDDSGTTRTKHFLTVESFQLLDRKEPEPIRK